MKANTWESYPKQVSFYYFFFSFIIIALFWSKGQGVANPSFLSFLPLFLSFGSMPVRRPSKFIWGLNFNWLLSGRKNNRVNMIKRFFNLRGIDLCRKCHYDSAFLLFMSTLNQHRNQDMNTTNRRKFTIILQASAITSIFYCLLMLG